VQSPESTTATSRPDSTKIPSRSSSSSLVDDIVVTEDADRRLPLDLRRPDDRELLRRYVRRGVSAVTEQPGGPDAVQAVVPGPTGDHVLELVVPLARRTTLTGSARPAAATVRTAGTGLHLPGGPWLSLAVRSPSHCHDQILAELAALAAGLTEHFDTWFWLRYADTTHGPHIRARFHGQPAALGGHLLPALSAWCSEMIRQRLSGGFTAEPYDQEIERYGGPDAIHAAEQVFAADSHLVLKALAAATDPDQRLVIAALSAATIARTVADGDPAALRRTSPRPRRSSACGDPAPAGTVNPITGRHQLADPVPRRSRMDSPARRSRLLPQHPETSTPPILRIGPDPPAHQPAPR